MKTVYFDCFAGVSGDMMLGALVDAGVSLSDLQAELGKLGVEGFSLSSRTSVKNGITGTKIDVVTEEQSAHRHLRHIAEIINQSELSDTIKSRSLAVFTTLAEAEAKIHNTTPEKIHFHEVGALDAIVDVVGSVIGLELLGAERIVSSPIHLGSGFVECQHGTIPIPAPATLEILRGFPVYSTGIEKEITTPTGAALLTTLASEFGSIPPMTVDKVGYGAGFHDLQIPNLLRLIVGSTTADSFESDEVELIEANIDDMNPEHYDYVLEKLMAQGALDATLTPMLMKKNRPAICLSVMTGLADTQKMLAIIFRETTTLGVRVGRLQRRKLPRESRTIQTKYGNVRVKISWLDERVRDIAPEYDDCKKLAAKHDLPLKQIYDDIRTVAFEKLGADKIKRTS